MPEIGKDADVDFRWNSWNVDHLAEHGVQPEEAQWVVEHATRPFPENRGSGKWAVWGKTSGGRYLQVIYIFDPPDTIYVIHARPLTPTEKRRLRRRKR